jgi:hypothetical protein
MTDEQINAAIDQVIGKNDSECGCCDCRQDWCTDLNAMHEAESTLTEDQLWVMAREIEKNWEDQWYFRATARQRAEAFLRTLGKWEEAK